MNTITIETEYSTITYDRDLMTFEGLFQGRRINNEDLFKDLASNNKIPARERQAIASEFVKLSEFDIVLLIDLPTGEDL